MTVKEIFKDIWSIGNVDVRAERINKLAEQDQELATKIEMLLRYSDRFQSVLEDPLIFLDSSSGNRQAARYSVTSELAKGGMGVITPPTTPRCVVMLFSSVSSVNIEIIFKRCSGFTAKLILLGSFNIPVSRPFTNWENSKMGGPFIA